MKVKIVGISGSPRKGNTDILVNECLDGARQLPDVETEFIHLADYRFNGPCAACLKCVSDPVKGNLCRRYKDDLNEILKRMLAADGFIFGSPVYYGGESGLMKVFIDRARQGCAGASKEQGSLRNKPFGVVTCADSRHGGQELTIFRIVHAFMFGGGGMIPLAPLVHCEPEGDSGFFGATGQQGFPYTVPDLAPGYLEAVKQDKGALKAARLLGRRVAEVAKIIKAGSPLITPETGETVRFPSESILTPEICAEAWQKTGSR